MKKLVVLVALALTVFGLGCLNFTSFHGAEHHADWAREKGLPEPSATILYLGMACAVAGGATLGWLAGSRGKG